MNTLAAEALRAVVLTIAPVVAELFVVSIRALIGAIRATMTEASDAEVRREAEVLAHVVEIIVRDVEHSDPPIADKRAEAQERIAMYVRGNPRLGSISLGRINTLIELAHDKMEHGALPTEGQPK